MHVADTENTSDMFPADLIYVPAAPCTFFFFFTFYNRFIHF